MMKRLCATLLMLAWGLSALAGGKSETIVYINGAKYYIHTVRAGETLYGLAKTYGVGEQVILENNPSIARGLQADANIKIPYMAAAPEPKLRSLTVLMLRAYAAADWNESSKPDIFSPVA